MSQQQHHQDLRFEIGDIWIDPPGTPIDSLPVAFTNIDAKVRIYVDGRTFFDAVLCLVEFAAVMNKWLSSADAPNSNFRFESSDEDEPNILSFQSVDEGIRIHSAWQKFRADEPVAMDHLRRELGRFVQDAIRRCRTDLDLEAERWIAQTD